MKSIKNILSTKKNAIFALCEQNGVIRLYAFGSVLRDDFNKKSDIDLIVEIFESDPLVKGEKLIFLWDSFEKIFNRKVDLLTNQPIKNIYLANEIEKTKRLIYERTS